MSINPYDPDLQPHDHEQWFRDEYHRLTNPHDPVERIRGWYGKANKKETVIATCDFETDPFDGHSNIRPFAVGFYDGTIYREHWGNDSPDILVNWIKAIDHNHHIIYAHNGGRFDFMFILDHLDPDIFCIGRRIVRAYITGHNGLRHELRDSASLIPVPLKDAAEKFQFDYGKMKSHRRDKYKSEIMAYLKQDCVGLRDTIMVGRSIVGDTLTMASSAMKQLNKAMPNVGKTKRAVEMLSEDEDTRYRCFYYGGRVQCFKRGILPGPWKVYDVTSSYPNVMQRYEHPISASYHVGKEVDGKTDFAVIDATSEGVLPMRADDGRLSFPKGRYLFNACGHEIRCGLELGGLHIHSVRVSYTSMQRTNFKPFIDKFFQLRREAQEKLKEAHNIGDRNKIAYWEAMQLFYKLVMNGAYGKFAQNPRKFKEYLILKLGDVPPDEVEGWTLSDRFELMDIYSKPSDQRNMWRSFLNVATGASITSAARVTLLQGLHKAVDPIYCDTDSLVCREFNGDVGGDLGQWKLETFAHTAAIVERKTYALFGDVSNDAGVNVKRMKDYGDKTCVKLASKGVRLTAAQIMKAAKGETVVYEPLAPTFRLDGSIVYTPRTIRMR